MADIRDSYYLNFLNENLRHRKGKVGFGVQPEMSGIRVFNIFNLIDHITFKTTDFSLQLYMAFLQSHRNYLAKKKMEFNSPA